MNFYIKELLETDRKSPANMVRLCTAITKLENLKDNLAVEPLILVACDETIPQDTDQNDPRIYAVWALGVIKDARAVKPLINLLLESDYTQLRCADAIVLGELENIEALPALEYAVLHDTNRLSYGGFDTNIVDAATEAIAQINQAQKKQ